MIAVDPGLFRATFSRFVTGVSVVTTPQTCGVHGMTANSVMSVSLDPALVLVSLGQCRMADLLRETGAYGISVLAANQLEHSKHFAGRPVPGLCPEFEWQAELPFLSGAVARIGARVVDAVPAGDHTLFIGAVTHLEHTDRPPLVFHGGAYRSLQVSIVDGGFFY